MTIIGDRRDMLVALSLKPESGSLKKGGQDVSFPEVTKSKRVEGSQLLTHRAKAEDHSAAFCAGELLNFPSRGSASCI